MDAPSHPRDIQLLCNGGQLPEQPERMAEWQARIDMAVYRSLILGASLAGQYVKPFFDAISGTPPDTDWESSAAYLARYAVYNPGSTLTSDERFRREVEFGRGSRCNWSKYQAGEVEEACSCQVRLSDRVNHINSAHSDAHWVVWNLMQVFWVAGNICLFTRGNYPSNCYSQSDDKENSVPLVLFHGFQIEKFQIPKILNWEKRPSIAMFGPKRQKLGNWERFYCPRGDCANTLQSIDVDNEYELEDHDGDVFDLSPLPMKFFEFFLQHYLKLGIIPGAFQREGWCGPYEEFFRNITIFAHDDVDGRVMSDPSRYPEFDGILDGTELLSLQDPPFVRRRVNYDDF
ncbi:hypothetical protein NLG97_g5722 [Lecanicillium saksenae]|uniref:Uncharacterized protein n=1 Tax=Lecanicillium saksenae TaxID=468837 RepID=A0ACC1QU19_9HYPO|nr:hypothetical protein NLG97_g5722 [Lecanicillium saksenae]